MKLPSALNIIKKSISVFFDKSNLIYFLKIYGVLVVFAILTYIFDLLTTNSNFGFSLADLTNKISALPAIFLSVVLLIGLAYLVVSFWVSAAGIVAVSNALSDKKGPIKEVFSFSWKKLWIFSVLSFVLGIIELFGLVFLIIPGIIFLIWFRFAGFEIMTKQVGVGGALSGSKKLVSGKFFPVLGRIAIFALFEILAQIVLGLIPFGLGSIIQPLFGALFILPYFLLYRELSTGRSTSI